MDGEKCYFCNLENQQNKTELKKSPFIRSFFMDLIISAASVAVALILCLCFGEGLVKYTEDANKLSYLTRYYNFANKETTGSYTVEDIAVISCHEKNASDSLIRKEIAEVIKRVGKFSPRAIGLDIRFRSKHSAKEDTSLVNAILENREKLVLARSWYEKEERSFFDIDSEGFYYGYTNLGDYYNHASSKAPSFAENILSRADMLDVSFLQGHRIIDFSNIGIEQMTGESFLSLSDARVKQFVGNKIVLIGDRNDEKDILQTPFLINGREWMPGLDYHVYCINSMRKGGPQFRENGIFNVILCVILTFVYALISSSFSSLIRSKKDSVHVYRLLLALKPIVMATLWAAIPFLLMFIFTVWLRIAPNLVLAMLSVSMILFFENYINELKESML